MKSFNFESHILIDLRSKIAPDAQLREQLRMHLVDRVLFFENPFPPIKTIANITNIDQVKVQEILERLELERLLFKKEDQYFASYPKFTLPFDAKAKSLLEALENNGIVPSFKRHQSIILDPKAIKKLKFPFDKKVSVHETRFDYYGDGIPFAVAYNYTPTYIIEDIDAILENNTTIKAFYKAHTSHLKLTYAMDSVFYPSYVADIFNIPYGKAGILIKADYHDEADKLVNVYRAYINGWYSVHCSQHKLD